MDSTIQSGTNQSDFIRCKHCGKVIGEKISGSKRLDSLMVAKMFGKKHKNVLADIKKIRNEFTGLNFQPSKYKDSTGRVLPCYIMTSEGLNFLSTRYRSNQTDKSSYIEIKHGKCSTKIYGNEQLEIVCDRCGEVNVIGGAPWLVK